jgi:2'-5' RNA ligase
MVVDDKCLRLFVAIPISPLPKLCDRVSELSATLSTQSGYRSVPFANWHVTLLYIGNTSAEAQQSIVQNLTQSLASCHCFDAKIMGIGCFPSNDLPKIIWAGMEGGQSLMELCVAVCNALAPLGILPVDEMFTPHLTLARLKRGAPYPSVHRFMAEYANEPWADIVVTEVVLFASINSPQGVRYLPLHRFGLKSGLFD